MKSQKFGNQFDAFKFEPDCYTNPSVKRETQNTTKELQDNNNSTLGPATHYRNKEAEF
jgi:hypothetical protein